MEIKYWDVGTWMRGNFVGKMVPVCFYFRGIFKISHWSRRAWVRDYWLFWWFFYFWWVGLKEILWDERFFYFYFIVKNGYLWLITFSLMIRSLNDVGWKVDGETRGMSTDKAIFRGGRDCLIWLLINCLLNSYLLFGSYRLEYIDASTRFTHTHILGS